MWLGLNCLGAGESDLQNINLEFDTIVNTNFSFPHLELAFPSNKPTSASSAVPQNGANGKLGSQGECGL